MKLKFIDILLIILFILISADAIFFGPLGLYIYNLPTRYAIVIVAIFYSIIHLIFNPIKNNSPFFFLIGIIFFILIWVLLVPLVVQGTVLRALEEARPLLFLGLIFPFYAVFSSISPHAVMRYLSAFSSVMALIVVASAFSANFLNNTFLAETLKSFYSLLAENNNNGIYIGPMSDGTYRITIISYMIFPLLVAYHTREKIEITRCLLFISASFATGTRSFFYVSVVIFLLAFLLSKGRRWSAIFGGGMILFYFIYNFSDFGNYRIFSVSNELESDSPRAEQLRYLWIMTKESLLLGNGFGAYSDQLVRSEAALFSYELTYVALVMKIGLIGSIFLIFSLFRTFGPAFQPHQNRRFILFISIAYIGITATNPILFTFQGFYVLSLLLAVAFNFKMPSNSRQ
jgi:hypothetical protein